jgi:hypothetical protein
MQQYSQLLAAVHTAATKEVLELSISTPTFDMGASVVTALGAVVGGTLAHLQLVECHLSADFWPAVWAHLPGLQVLTVRCRQPSDISLPDLASFCSSATHPLQLKLSPSLFTRFQQSKELQEQVNGQGMPLVKVVQHEEAERCQ